jgi:hypothetical protein
MAFGPNLIREYAPDVKDSQKAGKIAPDMPGIASELFDRLGRGFEKGLVSELLAGFMVLAGGQWRLPQER